jgi:hypothetical protein
MNGKLWRDVVTIHPAADIFPPLGADELRELADDIKANGLHEKVKIIERPRQRPDGSWNPYDPREQILIDGRNRLDAMELAGLPIFLRGSTELDPDIVDELDRDEIDPIAYVIGVNIRRRHLTGEQKRDLIAQLLKLDPSKSNRQIAALVGVDHKTVAPVRRQKEGRGEIPHVSKTVDTRGRRQPTTKPKVQADTMTTADRADPAKLIVDAIGQQLDAVHAAIRAKADRAEKPPEKPTPDVSRAADRAQARAKVIMLSADELESKLAPIVAGIKAEGKKRIATISISTVARLGELLDRQLHEWLTIVQLDDDLDDDDLLLGDDLGTAPAPE